MEPKQFNVRIPLFSHAEVATLRRELRAIGSKPSKDDLIAALIHSAAMAAAADTKALVKAFVIYELGQEELAAAKVVGGFLRAHAEPR